MYLTIPTFESPDTAAMFAILGTEDSRRDTVLVDEVTADSRTPPLVGTRPAVRARG